MIQLSLVGLADLLMLPAIFVMQQNRRHFEVFVASLHILVSVLHNISQSFDVSLFLTVDDWHNMSDVLWIAYFLLLCIHLTGLRDIQTTTVLRYIAFSCAWTAKTKDKWTSNTYSTVLVATGLLLALVTRVVLHKSVAPFHPAFLVRGAAAGALAMLLFVSPRFISLSEAVFFLLIVPGFHISLGAMFYCGWKSVPPAATPKLWEDDLTAHFI